MELKTLKDIMKPFRNTDKKAEMFEAITKQEAIKWVKELSEEQRYKKGVEIPKEHELFFDSEYYSFEYVIEFIKHFFNLTEEELK